MRQIDKVLHIFFALRYTVHFDVAVREVGEEDIGYRNYGGKRGKIEFRNQLEVQLRRAERNRFRGLFKFRLRRGRLNSNRRVRAILLIAGVSRASFLVVFWNQIAKFFVFYVFWLASTKATAAAEETTETATTTAACQDECQQHTNFRGWCLESHNHGHIFCTNLLRQLESH